MNRPIVTSTQVVRKGKKLDVQGLTVEFRNQGSSSVRIGLIRLLAGESIHFECLGRDLYYRFTDQVRFDLEGSGSELVIVSTHT
ncbi:MAG: hypothetical protein AAFY71_07830 [Bacteroidota bacterium]